MRARQVWHPRAPRARRSGALIAVASLLISAAALPSAAAPRQSVAPSEVEAISQIDVRIPSNDELRDLLADDPSVRVVERRMGRAADGALGAGLEIVPAGYGSVWLGAYSPPAGVAGAAWCVQARIYPSSGDTPVSAVDLADNSLSYAEEAHGDLGNAAVQAALGYLVHMRHERPGTMAGGDVARVKALIEAATPVFVKDLASQLIGDGDRNAGPYGAPSISVDEQSLRHGEIHGLGVRSASGQHIAGSTGEVVLVERVGGQWVPTDKAVFDMNGNRRADPGETNTWTGTSQSNPITLRYVAKSGAGEIEFRASWTGQRAVRQYGFYDMGGNRQNVIVLGPIAPAGDPLTYGSPPFSVAADFEVVPTSQVSSTSVGKGETVTDVLTTTLAAGDSWVQVDGERVPLKARATVYGPLPQQAPPSATVPAGTPVAETRLVDVSGPGDSSHEFTFATGGTYAIVWSFLKADQGANAPYLRADRSDDFMAPTETFRVKVDVALASEVGARLNDDDGDGLRDWVTVSLAEGDVWPADDAGNPLVLTVRNTAFAPQAVPSDRAATAPAGADVLATELMEFSGPGRQRTGAVSTGGEYGFVAWQAEVRLEDQSAPMAELLSGPVLSPWMEEVETTSVRHPLAHRSEMREWNVELGGRVLDDVVLSGFPDDHGEWPGLNGWGGDLDVSTFTVYGPFAQRWTEATVPDDAPVLMSTELPARNGTYRVGLTDQDAIQPNLPGCYIGVWSFEGDDRVQPFTSRADDVLEHFCVRDDPSLWLDMMSTATQSATAGEGVVADTVLVIGPALPADGATLTWEQCVWAPGEEPGCADPVVTAEVDVSRAGAYVHPETPAPSVEDLPPGTLEAHVGWAPVLRDRGGVELLREPFGTPSQTTLVRAELPDMVSRATDRATTGEQIGDRVTLTGPMRSDWTLRWEGCWLDESGTCPDGAAIEMGEPVRIDPGVEVYDASSWAVEIPQGTAPGAVLRFGWVPVLTDAVGVELLREDWGVAAQTTIVQHPMPEIGSTATGVGVVGDVATDTVTITGPVQDGSVIVWDTCYWLAGDSACRPDAENPERGPVIAPETEPVAGPDGERLPGADPQIGIVLPALGLGETLEVTGPRVELTDGGLPRHPGLRLSWMPQVLSPDGQVVVAEPWGVESQTTVVMLPPITTATEAYASSEDGPWFGDRIGDRITVDGDIWPAGAFEGVGHDPDTVTVHLYAWGSGGPPRCEGEPLATYEVPLEIGVAQYDTGELYATPADRTDLVYGFQETTRSRGVETVSECGLASETLRPRERPAPPGPTAPPDLALTGGDVGLLVTGLVVMLALGGALVRYRRVLVRHLDRMEAGAPPG